MINSSLSRAASHLALALCAAALLFFAAGCENLHQDMGNQPKNKALSPSDFFGDGRSERPLIENTVARGALATTNFSSRRSPTRFRSRSTSSFLNGAKSATK